MALEIVHEIAKKNVSTIFEENFQSLRPVECRDIICDLPKSNSSNFAFAKADVWKGLLLMHSSINVSINVKYVYVENDNRSATHESLFEVRSL